MKIFFFYKLKVYLTKTNLTLPIINLTPNFIVNLKSVFNLTFIKIESKTKTRVINIDQKVQVPNN